MSVRGEGERDGASELRDARDGGLGEERHHGRTDLAQAEVLRLRGDLTDPGLIVLPVDHQALADALVAVRTVSDEADAEVIFEFAQSAEGHETRLHGSILCSHRLRLRVAIDARY